MNFKNLILFVAIIGLTGCIKDDIVFDEVEEVIRITNAIDSLQLGTSYQLTTAFFNNVGQQEEANIDWRSTDPTKITVDDTGLLTAIELGTAIIIASIETVDQEIIRDSISIVVGDQTTVIEEPMERTGMLNTTSSYALTGDFTLSETADGLVLSFDANYNASSALPGLYVYLTNNPNTTNNAYEIGKVETFNGVHSYTIDSSISIQDYSHVLYFCKPFNVKVGDGAFDN